MARDLWDRLDKIKPTSKRNGAKRAFLAGYLELPLDEADAILRGFVSGSRVSQKKVHSPARWGINSIFPNKDAFPHRRVPMMDVRKNACRLKWAFNVKPDIVIELKGKGIVCIEAKVESPEGRYASSRADKQALYGAFGTNEEADAFQKEEGRQCNVQRVLMQDILGYSSDRRHMVFLFLPTKPPSECAKDMKYVSWFDAFSCFQNSGRDTSDIATKMIDTLKEIK